MLQAISIANLFLLHAFAYTYLVKYNFGSNFGQLFYDYSGKGNHGQNGNSLSSDSYDTTPTDRGAYSSGTKYIKLPPNLQVSSSVNLGSVFSITIWYLPTSNNKINLTYRTAGSYYFNLLRYPWNSYISMRTHILNYYGDEKSGGTITNSIWNLFIVTNSGSTMKVYTSSSTAVMTFEQLYSESGTVSHYIGYTSESFHGFVWNFNIFQDSVNPADFFVSSYSPGTCTLQTCPVSCSPGLRGDSGSFCISTEEYDNKNGQGNYCSMCSFGCNNDNTCLNCNSCALKSCEISGNNVVCVCPGGTGTTTGCTCSGSSEMVGGYIKCAAGCYGECSSCSSQYVCTACVDSNASPYASYGCTCKTGYYNTTALINLGTCSTCYSDCSTCDQASKCLSCKDSNSDIHTDIGCICKSSYYNITSLSNNGACLKCNQDCKTCSQALLCTECITTNAIPHGTVGCVCNTGFYNSTSLTVAGACLSCFTECKKCSSQYNCTECTDTNAEPQDTGGCLCKDGYYNTTQLVANGNCKKCFIECELCSDEFNCSKCIDSNADVQNNGGCLCKNGYFNITQLSVNGDCRKCLPECEICSSETNCSKCVDSNATIQDVGGCLCKDGYYNTSQLITNGDCLPCSSECLTCTNFSECVICIDTNSVASPTGGCSCKSGYYNITQIDADGICLPCFEECTECSEKFNCLQCQDSNSTSQAFGGCLCNPGYYNLTQITTEGACLPCFSECKTCSDPFICDECIDSNAEKQLSGGCLCKSGYYNITKLNSEGQCLADACTDPNSFENSSEECECNEGYYKDNNGICIECFKDCLICNSIMCLVCKDNSANFNGNKCICMNGYYNSSDTDELNCTECPKHCETCDSSINCLTCDIHNMNVINGTCLCPKNSKIINNTCIAYDGFFLDYSDELGYFTQECDPSCETCSQGGFHNCTRCNSEFELVNGECLKCPSLCSECKNSCSTCVENAKFNTSECNCILGFEKFNNQCNEKYFQANLTILDKNYAKIMFSENTNETLSLENFKFTVKDRDDLKVKLIKNTNNIQYQFALMFSNSISKGTEASVEIIGKIIFSKFNSQLKNYVLVGLLDSFVHTTIDPSVETILESTSSVSKSAVSSSLGASILSNPSAAWTVLNTVQLIAYIPLSSAPLSNNTRLFLTAFSGYNIIPNPIVYIFSEKATSEPYLEAKEYGINSSVFLINIGPSFSTFLAITIMWPFMFILSKYTKGKIAVKVIRILGNYKYSFFLRFWTQMYVEIGIYGLIQLKSKPLTHFSGYFNILLATVSTIFFVLTIPLLLVSTRVSSSQINENSQEFFKKYGSLYSEFKNDRGYWSSQFYFLYFIRRLAFVFCQIYLNHSHYLQTILNACFSAIVLLHLIIYRPFKDRAIMISNLVGELCISLVMVLCCLFVWDLDKNIQEKVEILIMFTVFAAMGVQFLVSIYLFGKAMVILWRKIEKERSLKFVENASRISL